MPTATSVLPSHTSDRASLVHFDRLLLQQAADTALECFLAEAEDGADLFGARLVSKARRAFALEHGEHLQDLLRVASDLLVGVSPKGELDLSVWQNVRHTKPRGVSTAK